MTPVDVFVWIVALIIALVAITFGITPLIAVPWLCGFYITKFIIWMIGEFI